MCQYLLILTFQVTPTTIMQHGRTLALLIQLPVHKPYITDIDDQLHQEIELKTPQHVMLIEKDQPEEVDFVNYQLISMLNSSVHVYHKVQIAVDQGGK